jgi:serine/threonine protein kinase
MECFLDDATIIRKLGQGNYGSVYLVQKPDGNKYAVKYMYVYEESNKIGIDKSTLLDIDALLRLRNVPDVINIIDICYRSSIISIIMEAMDSDLSNFIAKTTFNDRIKLINKLLVTLIRVSALMESLNLTHYDIKPANVLVDTEFNFKVTDFGLSKASFGKNVIPTTDLYTLWYRPPEFLTNRNRLTFPIFAGDIWAIGLTVLEFIIGNPVFPGNTVNEMLQLIYNSTIHFNMSQLDFNYVNTNGTITGILPVANYTFNSLDIQTTNVLSRMLSLNPNDRPSGVELLDELDEKINPEFLISLYPPEYARRIHSDSIKVIIDVSQILNLSKASTLIALEIFTRYLDMLSIDLTEDLNTRALATLRIAEQFAETNTVNTQQLSETYELIYNKSISNTYIAEMEKDILNRINFQIYNLNLGPVIERSYLKNVDFQKINLNQFAEPLSRWLI